MPIEAVEHGESLEATETIGVLGRTVEMVIQRRPLLEGAAAALARNHCGRVSLCILPELMRRVRLHRVYICDSMWFGVYDGVENSTDRNVYKADYWS